VRFSDPKELNFELLQLPIHFMPNPNDAPEWLKEAHDKIRSADAFLIASAEYNSVLPAALTNMLDHFPPASFRNRPVGTVSYSVGKNLNSFENRGSGFTVMK